MNEKIKKTHFLFFFMLFMILFLVGSYVHGFSEKIDGVVAVVNNEVITLTDLRIAKDFGLYDLKKEASDESLYRSVLESMISQKLVQQFTGSEINISEREIDRFFEDLEEGFENSGWEEKLSFFGMTVADLRDYCAQYLSYKKIVSERFSRSVKVSLKELEEYYNQVYIPKREAQGAVIQQMVDILPEIESAVKERKTRVQIEEWIENLKSQAEIRIYLNGYMEFFQKKAKSSEPLKPSVSHF
ncbi:MAG: SurA N-terminal domain-containing protein [Acidobacteriota bacterium]